MGASCRLRVPERRQPAPRPCQLPIKASGFWQNWNWFLVFIYLFIYFATASPGTFQVLTPAGHHLLLQPGQASLHFQVAVTPTAPGPKGAASRATVVGLRGALRPPASQDMLGQFLCPTLSAKIAGVVSIFLTGP